MKTYTIESILFNMKENIFVILTTNDENKSNFQVYKIFPDGMYSITKRIRKNDNMKQLEKYLITKNFKKMKVMRVCFFDHLNIRTMIIGNNFFYHLSNKGKILSKTKQITGLQYYEIFQLCKSYWESVYKEKLKEKYFADFIDNIFLDNNKIQEGNITY